MREDSPSERAHTASARDTVQIAPPESNDQRNPTSDRTQESGHRAEVRVYHLRAERRNFLTKPEIFTNEQRERGPRAKVKSVALDALIMKRPDLSAGKDHCIP